MGRPNINRGTSAGDGTGSNLFTVFGQVKNALTEIYSGIRGTFPRRPGGKYIPPYIIQTGTGAMASGVAYATPLIVGGDGTNGGTLSDLSVNVTTAVAGGAIKVAVYKDLNGDVDVNTRLLDATATANLDASTTGEKACLAAGNTLGLALNPGDAIWFVLIGNNATIQVTCISSTVFQTFLPMGANFQRNNRRSASASIGAGTAFPDISGVTFSDGNSAASPFCSYTLT